MKPLRHNNSAKRVFCALLVSVFCIQSTLAHALQGVISPMPKPGVLTPLSAPHQPLLLKGLRFHPENPLLFDFMLDGGQHQLAADQREAESMRLVRYFLSALTTPSADLWVNLSPHEPDRIVEDSLASTEMGRDLLAQDYLLKQITSSLLHPEHEAGKAFWGKVYAKAFEMYGTTEIPVDTMHKVWIVPEQATVYEEGDTVYVREVELEVLLERDYVAAQQTNDKRQMTNDHSAKPNGKSMVNGQSSAVHLDDLSSDIMRDVILPVLKQEVNEGENFATLRQIVYSLVLAKWLKEKLKVRSKQYVVRSEAQHPEVSLPTTYDVLPTYIDSNKTSGIDVADPTLKQSIYDQYLQALKKGVFDFVQADSEKLIANSFAHNEVERRYFSGGFTDNTQMTWTRMPKPDAAMRSATPDHLRIQLDPASQDNAMTVRDFITEEQLDDFERRSREIHSKTIENLDDWVTNLFQRKYGDDWRDVEKGKYSEQRNNLTHRYKTPPTNMGGWSEDAHTLYNEGSSDIDRMLYFLEWLRKEIDGFKNNLELHFKDIVGKQHLYLGIFDEEEKKYLLQFADDMIQLSDEFLSELDPIIASLTPNDGEGPDGSMTGILPHHDLKLDVVQKDTAMRARKTVMKLPIKGERDSQGQRGDGAMTVDVEKRIVEIRELLNSDPVRAHEEATVFFEQRSYDGRIFELLFDVKDKVEGREKSFAFLINHYQNAIQANPFIMLKTASILKRIGLMKGASQIIKLVREKNHVDPRVKKLLKDFYNLKGIKKKKKLSSHKPGSNRNIDREMVRPGADGALVAKPYMLKALEDNKAGAGAKVFWTWVKKRIKDRLGVRARFVNPDFEVITQDQLWNAIINDPKNKAVIEFGNSIVRRDKSGPYLDDSHLSELEKLIHRIHLPESAKQALMEAADRLPDGPVIVRASHPDEDGFVQNLAGQFISRKADNKAWMSFKVERVIKQAFEMMWIQQNAEDGKHIPGLPNTIEINGGIGLEIDAFKRFEVSGTVQTNKHGFNNIEVVRGQAATAVQTSDANVIQYQFDRSAPQATPAVRPLFEEYPHEIEYAGETVTLKNNPERIKALMEGYNTPDGLRFLTEEQARQLNEVAMQLEKEAAYELALMTDSLDEYEETDRITIELEWGLTAENELVIIQMRPIIQDFSEPLMEKPTSLTGEVVARAPVALGQGVVEGRVVVLDKSVTKESWERFVIQNPSNNYIVIVEEGASFFNDIDQLNHVVAVIDPRLGGSGAHNVMLINGKIGTDFNKFLYANGPAMRDDLYQRFKGSLAATSHQGVWLADDQSYQFFSNGQTAELIHPDDDSVVDQPTDYMDPWPALTYLLEQRVDERILEMLFSGTHFSSLWQQLDRPAQNFVQDVFNLSMNEAERLDQFTVMLSSGGYDKHFFDSFSVIISKLKGVLNNPLLPPVYRGSELLQRLNHLLLIEEYDDFLPDQQNKSQRQRPFTTQEPKLRILIADDEGPNIRMIQRSLKFGGFRDVVETVSAESLDIANNALGQERFDLLISDIKLGSGNEILYRSLVDERIKFLIALSGGDTEALAADLFGAKRIREQGFFYAFNKPYDMKILMERVKGIREQQLADWRAWMVEQGHAVEGGVEGSAEGETGVSSSQSEPEVWVYNRFGHLIAETARQHFYDKARVRTFDSWDELQTRLRQGAPELLVASQFVDEEDVSALLLSSTRDRGTRLILGSDRPVQNPLQEERVVGHFEEAFFVPQVAAVFERTDFAMTNETDNALMVKDYMTKALKEGAAEAGAKWFWTRMKAAAKKRVGDGLRFRNQTSHIATMNDVWDAMVNDEVNQEFIHEGNRLVAQLDGEDLNAQQKQSLHNLIRQIGLPKSVEHRLKEIANALPDDHPIIVRASHPDEDGFEQNLAGEFVSKKNKNKRWFNILVDKVIKQALTKMWIDQHSASNRIDGIPNRIEAGQGVGLQVDLFETFAVSGTVQTNLYGMNHIEAVRGQASQAVQTAHANVVSYQFERDRPDQEPRVQPMFERLPFSMEVGERTYTIKDDYDEIVALVEQYQTAEGVRYLNPDQARQLHEVAMQLEEEMAHQLAIEVGAEDQYEKGDRVSLELEWGLTPENELVIIQARPLIGDFDKPRLTMPESLKSKLRHSERPQGVEESQDDGKVDRIVSMPAVIGQGHVQGRVVVVGRNVTQEEFDRFIAQHQGEDLILVKAEGASFYSYQASGPVKVVIDPQLGGIGAHNVTLIHDRIGTGENEFLYANGPAMRGDLLARLQLQPDPMMPGISVTEQRYDYFSDGVEANLYGTGFQRDVRRGDTAGNIQEFYDFMDEHAYTQQQDLPGYFATEVSEAKFWYGFFTNVPLGDYQRGLVQAVMDLDPNNVEEEFKNFVRSGAYPKKVFDEIIPGLRQIERALSSPLLPQHVHTEWVRRLEQITMILDYQSFWEEPEPVQRPLTDEKPKLKVLRVDDKQSMREAFITGIQVIFSGKVDAQAVSSVEEAEKLMRDDIYDVVITDVQGVGSWQNRSGNLLETQAAQVVVTSGNIEAIDEIKKLVGNKVFYSDRIFIVDKSKYNKPMEIIQQQYDQLVERWNNWKEQQESSAESPADQNVDVPDTPPDMNRDFVIGFVQDGPDNFDYVEDAIRERFSERNVTVIPLGHQHEIEMLQSCDLTLIDLRTYQSLSDGLRSLVKDRSDRMMIYSNGSLSSEGYHASVVNDLKHIPAEDTFEPLEQQDLMLDRTGMYMDQWQEERLAQLEAWVKANPRPEKVHMLIVEDDSNAREMLEFQIGVFEDARIKIHVAVTFAEAALLAKQFPMAFVSLDIAIPDGTQEQAGDVSKEEWQTYQDLFLREFLPNIPIKQISSGSDADVIERIQRKYTLEFDEYFRRSKVSTSTVAQGFKNASDAFFLPYDQYETLKGVSHGEAEQKKVWVFDSDGAGELIEQQVRDRWGEQVEVTRISSMPTLEFKLKHGTPDVLITDRFHGQDEAVEKKNQLVDRADVLLKPLEQKDTQVIFLLNAPTDQLDHPRVVAQVEKAFYLPKVEEALAHVDFAMKVNGDPIDAADYEQAVNAFLETYRVKFDDIARRGKDMMRQFELLLEQRQDLISQQEKLMLISALFHRITGGHVAIFSNLHELTREVGKSRKYKLAFDSITEAIRRYQDFVEKGHHLATPILEKYSEISEPEDLRPLYRETLAELEAMQEALRDSIGATPWQARGQPLGKTLHEHSGAKRDYMQQDGAMVAKSKTKSYKERELEMVRRGLTYREAQIWHQNIVDGARVPYGFWVNETTAKNMILVVLDSVWGFKPARERGDLKTMVRRYRKHVLGYKRKTDRFPNDGQQVFFYENGLKSLMTVHREFLDKVESPAALLRFALPEMIDVRNPDALDPIEIEHNYWTYPQNALYHINLMFDSIPGFAKARANNNIKKMAQLYRQYVLAYQGTGEYGTKTGQIAFMYERGGLRGLMANPKPFLEKLESPFSVLKFALPGLIDENNPDALQPIEVGDLIWDEVTARKYILKMLDSIPGFATARAKNNIKEMANLYRQYVLAYQGTGEYGTKTGQIAFMFEQGRLRGLIAQPRPFFEKMSHPPSVIEFALPDLIDENNPDALQPIEVGGVVWNKSNARKYALKALDRVPGFMQARQGGDVKRMAQLFRQYVFDYQSPVPGQRGGAQAFFYEEGGLSTLMAHKREFLERSGSPLSIMKLAVSELIDKPDGLSTKLFRAGGHGDEAMVGESVNIGPEGGIDLKEFTIESLGNGVDIPLPQADAAMINQLQQGNFDGLVPRVISYTPAVSLLSLLD